MPPMDDRSRSGGFPLAVVALIAILFIIAIGGGGIFVVTSLRYQYAAERAREEAVLHAERAELEAQRAKEAADRAVRDLTAPEKGPADPLQTVNDAFRAAYNAARQDALTAAGPVIVAGRE